MSTVGASASRHRSGDDAYDEGGEEDGDEEEGAGARGGPEAGGSPARGLDGTP